MPGSLCRVTLLLAILTTAQFEGSLFLEKGCDSHPYVVMVLCVYVCACVLCKESRKLYKPSYLAYPWFNLGTMYCHLDHGERQEDRSVCALASLVQLTHTDTPLTLPNTGRMWKWQLVDHRGRKCMHAHVCMYTQAWLSLQGTSAITAMGCTVPGRMSQAWPTHLYRWIPPPEPWNLGTNLNVCGPNAAAHFWLWNQYKWHSFKMTLKVAPSRYLTWSRWRVHTVHARQVQYAA